MSITYIGNDNKHHTLEVEELELVAELISELIMYHIDIIKVQGL